MAAPRCWRLALAFLVLALAGLAAGATTPPEDTSTTPLPSANGGTTLAPAGRVNGKAKTVLECATSCFSVGTCDSFTFSEGTCRQRLTIGLPHTDAQHDVSQSTSLHSGDACHPTRGRVTERVVIKIGTSSTPTTTNTWVLPSSSWHKLLSATTSDRAVTLTCPKVVSNTNWNVTSTTAIPPGEEGAVFQVTTSFEDFTAKLVVQRAGPDSSTAAGWGMDLRFTCVLTTDVTVVCPRTRSFSRMIKPEPLVCVVASTVSFFLGVTCLFFCHYLLRVRKQCFIAGLCARVCVRACMCARRGVCFSSHA